MDTIMIAQSFTLEPLVKASVQYIWQGHVLIVCILQWCSVYGKLVQIKRFMHQRLPLNPPQNWLQFKKLSCEEPYARLVARVLLLHEILN